MEVQSFQAERKLNCIETTMRVDQKRDLMNEGLGLNQTQGDNVFLLTELIL